LKRHTIKSERKIGGDPELVNNFEEWKNSIKYDPIVYKVNKFLRWTDIVKDPVIKANLEKAYKERDIQFYQ
jgi:hypothetical protein